MTFNFYYMKKTEIFILCNSRQCLEEISSGRFKKLQAKDLFTCNNAYTFFRTEGNHFNLFTDTIDIVRHTLMPETLSNGYEKQVHFIYSQYGTQMACNRSIFPGLNLSPIKTPSSSGLGALAWLNKMRNYDVIWLIGYTLDESENELWNEIALRYEIACVRIYVWKLTLKK